MIIFICFIICIMASFFLGMTVKGSSSSENYKNMKDVEQMKFINEYVQRKKHNG